MKLARVSSNKGSLSRNAKTQTQGKNMVRDRISFASRLKELRMIAHISQIELAEQLHVSRAAVANWETGRTRPDIANIPALCSLLDISIEEFFSDSSDPDSNAELRLLSSYRKLPSAHRAIVLSMTEQLLAAERSTRIDPQNVQEMQIELVQLPMADDAVAAGFNLDDFSAHCKQVYLHSSPITRRADLIFHVNGDSMEPAFPNQSYVLERDETYKLVRQLKYVLEIVSINRQLYVTMSSYQRWRETEMRTDAQIAASVVKRSRKELPQILPAVSSVEQESTSIPAQKFFTVPEAASFLHLSERTVYRLCSDGRIPAKRLASQWRIARTDLERLSNQNNSNHQGEEMNGDNHL